MQFGWQGQQVTWKGMQLGQVLLMSKKQMAKVKNAARTRVYAMMITGFTPEFLQMEHIDATHLLVDLQQLLQLHSNVFAVPRELPPPREQDHKIPLLDEYQPFKVSPYQFLRYRRMNRRKWCAKSTSDD